MTEEVHPLLRKHASDHAAELLRAATGPLDLLFPGSSKVVDLLVEQVIPLREERFAQFMTNLSRRLKALEQRLGEGCFGKWTLEKQALFEEGARVSVKALSSERIDQISKLVADGLTEDDAGAARTRLMLDLIGELSDLDIIVLASDTRLGHSQAWRERHSAALTSPLAGRPPDGASREEQAEFTRKQREASIASRLQIDRLVRLGLLEREQQHYIDESRTFRGPGRIETKIGRPEITKLGTAVLIKLEVIDGQMPWASGN